MRNVLAGRAALLGGGRRGSLFLALARQLLREEVVQGRPDRRYRPEQDHVVERGGDGRRENVGAELELQPEDEVASEIESYLVVGVLPDADQGQDVAKGRRQYAKAHHGGAYSLDDQTQITDRRYQVFFHLETVSSVLINRATIVRGKQRPALRKP